jgi:hypothetical protein
MCFESTSQERWFSLSSRLELTEKQRCVNFLAVSLSWSNQCVLRAEARSFFVSRKLKFISMSSSSKLTKSSIFLLRERFCSERLERGVVPYCRREGLTLIPTKRVILNLFTADNCRAFGFESNSFLRWLESYILPLLYFSSSLFLKRRPCTSSKDLRY